ncbi:MAG: hypothetical protein FJ315_07635, partial [SAR202 cluster bacterium]|nr:hypothetical protein [SAR202 cluster bacterium]
MALRLAGEPAGVVRGLDGVGWLREMTAGDAQAGLKVDQLGVGRVVDFKDGGASKFSVLDGGRVAVADSVEFGAAPASSGVVRWSNNSVMKARNAANSADLDLARLDSSDVLALGGAGVTGLTIGYTGGALALVSVYPALAVAGASQATAVSGTYRGPNAVTLMGRNAANSADVALAHLDASNDVQIGGEGAGKA